MVRIEWRRRASVRIDLFAAPELTKMCPSREITRNGRTELSDYDTRFHTNTLAHSQRWK